jgi:cytochrome c biogenesis protein CcmG/thiol:disulfide interchange protein DsbE
MGLTFAVVLATLLALATPAAADKALDDLLFDLQLVPLAGQTPAPFALERLADGKKVSLAEQRGQVVMLYFWATW